MERVEPGEVVDLGDRVTRRGFLAAIAAAGSGVAGLRAVVEDAVGSPVDGVPVVWTRDRHGRPDRVRVVSRDRYRALQSYCALDPGRLCETHDAVTGVAAAPAGDDGLALSLVVDRDDWSVRRSLPSRVAGLPVDYERRPGEPRPAAVCERRERTYYRRVQGNVPTYGKTGDGERMQGGTVGLVCWNADPAAPHRCLLTAAHVAVDGGEAAEHLYQDGWTGGEYREGVVGSHEVHSLAGNGGLDAAKYRLAGGASAIPLGTLSAAQPDVTGVWEFAGLADATTDGSVDVSFAGRSTCYGEGECVGTERGNTVDYAARLRPPVATAGDSGGPFVDEDGRLVALFSYYNPRWGGGPVGAAVLDGLGATLVPPREEESDGE